MLEAVGVVAAKYQSVWAGVCVAARLHVIQLTTDCNQNAWQSRVAFCIIWVIDTMAVVEDSAPHASVVKTRGKHDASRIPIFVAFVCVCALTPGLPSRSNHSSMARANICANMRRRLASTCLLVHR